MIRRVWRFGLVFSLLAAVLCHDTNAQELHLMKDLLGSWEGRGTLFGSDAAFRMTWDRTLGGRFVKLTFSNSVTTPDGKVRSMEAEAFYRRAGSEQFEGTWFDTRGVILPLTAKVYDSSLTTDWGNQETERGRTVYTILPDGRMQVEDLVEKAGVLTPFGRAVYSRVPSQRRVIIKSHGWELVGDLVMPPEVERAPAVLMFNKAAGDRSSYETLAAELAGRGIASLRLDLRGHGESTNLGQFVPGEQPKHPFIWDAEQDVITAHAYLKHIEGIDSSRIGMVGASYSGEEVAEAGRLAGYAQAYVELSPGSFSDESIDGIDASGVPWLFIAGRQERYLQDITAAVREKSARVEMIVLPGTEHATRLLTAYPDLDERIAVWLEAKLQRL